MLTAVVAAGVGALVAESPVVLGVLTVAGAVYLICLGVGALRHPAEPTWADDGAAASSVSQALKGAGISGLNPKGLLLLVSLLPQWIDARAP